MAIIFCDGFNGAGNPYYSNKYESYDGTIPTSQAARTGNAWKWRSGFATKTLASNEGTLVVGFAYQDTYDAINKTILKLIDGSTTQIYLYVNTSRQVQVKNGDGTTLATSTSTVQILDDASYTYIELKVVIGNSGSYTLKINGTTEATASGVDTQNSANSYANKVAIGNDDTSENAAFDDFYVDNANFLGTVKIYSILPTGDSSVAWTPSAGSNYECVDDAVQGHDGDSTYVAATTTAVKDLYTLGDLSLSSGVIKGIAHNFVGRKTDVNPTSIIPKIQTSSTEYSGTTQSMTTSYAHYQTVWETNPYSGSGWTYGAIDTLIAGMETA